MVFTQDEFDIMVDELLYADPVSFDMLCAIAQKALERKVRYWCNSDDILRNRGYEEDIMQEIHVRLIKTVISGFLLKKCKNGDFNNDPEGFEDWMFRVATNVKNDFARRLRSGKGNTDSLEQLEEALLSGKTDDQLQVRIQRLSMAFSIALSADVSVYKVLIWVAQFLYILEGNTTKIQSNERIVHDFSEATLGQMYEKLQKMSKKVPWVQITAQQHEKICKALAKPYGESCYGQMRLRDFYMKQNAQPAPKKSISDWANRMNHMIRRKLGQWVEDENSPGRRQTDEPSDN